MTGLWEIPMELVDVIRKFFLENQIAAYMRSHPNENYYQAMAVIKIKNDEK